MKELSKKELQVLYRLSDQIDQLDRRDLLKNGLQTYLSKLSCSSVLAYGLTPECTQVGEMVSDSLLNDIKQQSIINKPQIMVFEEVQVLSMPFIGNGLFLIIGEELNFSDVFLKEFQKIHQKFLKLLGSNIEKQKTSHQYSEFIRDAMANALPYLIWIKDVSGRYLDCNQAYCETLGKNKDQIIGYTDFDLVESNQAGFYHSRDQEVLESGKSITYEESIVSKAEGTTRLFEITKQALYSKSQELIGVYCFSREITDNKSLQKALQNAHHTFESLANLLPIPVWETDAVGKLIYLNAAGLQLFDLNADEISGINIFSFIPEKYHQQLLNLLNTDKPDIDSLEIECVRPDQSKIPMVIYGAGMRNNTNRLIGYRGSIIDISDQKKVENELLALSQLQNLLIRISTEYINVSLSDIEEATLFALKEIGEFVEADRAYIFEYNHEKETTSNTFEWCAKDIEPQIEQLKDIPYTEIPKWTESHFNKETIYINDVAELIDQDLKDILEPQGIKSLITVPMMNKEICVGFVGFDSVKKHHLYTEKEKATLEVFAQVLVNIQLRSSQETELKQAKDKAEQAEKAQFNFLSTMSHEIRTPLNAVIGLTNILLMEEPKKSQLINLKTLKQSSNNLLNIINDILDFNKLMSGNVILEHKNFNFKELVSSIYQSLRSVAANKGVNLNLSFPNEIPHVLVGDSTRITQVINNLLTNAIKFTKKGQVCLDVKLLEQYHSEVLLHISVEDNGIGIPKDKFDDIFEEFRQSNESITREFGGTGLGLPIVKKLLKNMGSDIYLESELGKGSIFSFNLKLPLGDQSFKDEAEEDINFDTSLQGMKILVVEDNRVNQLVVTKFLLDWKCEFEIANNGQLAVDKVKNKQFDAVLMDLHMPVMDGYEATSQIRQMEDDSKKNIPIIALSASALGEIEVRAKKFGMDAFVTKPFAPRILFKTLYSFKKA